MTQAKVGYLPSGIAIQSEVSPKLIHLDLPGCLDSRERVGVCWLRLVPVEPVPGGVAVTDCDSTPLCTIATSPNHTSQNNPMTILPDQDTPPN